METTKYSGMFDELEKIAEEKQKFVTKEKFKRHLKMVVPAALGTGLGYAGGEALHRVVKDKNRVGRLAKLVRKHPKALKYGPAALGMALGGVAMLAKRKDKQVRDYVEHGDGRSK